MKKFNKITPEGTKDILFEECLSQRTVSERLTHIFKMRGYNEVITPGMEYYDVFDAPNAAIPQYEMYKSTDNKGRLIVFRPDLTLPIARLTATRLQAMEKPIRLYYNQPIYRNRKDLSGRSDETTQAGIELLGASGLKADIEVIAAAVEALSACTESFRLEIGSAKFFGALADELPVSADKKEDIRQTIESNNYAALGICATHSQNPCIPKPSKSCRACSAGQRFSRKRSSSAKATPCFPKRSIICARYIPRCRRSASMTA